MRRKEKGIMDKTIIEDIIRSSAVCRIALVDEGKPYIVPLCFGYDGKSLFFHSALSGRKIDIIKKNPRACFEMEADVEFVESENACNWSAKFKSIIGYGRISFIDDKEEKINGLGFIMKHYSGKSFSFSDAAINRTCVFKLEIEELTAKQA